MYAHVIFFLGIFSVHKMTSVDASSTCSDRENSRHLRQPQPQRHQSPSLRQQLLLTSHSDGFKHITSEQTAERPRDGSPVRGSGLKRSLASHCLNKKAVPDHCDSGCATSDDDDDGGGSSSNDIPDAAVLKSSVPAAACIKLDITQSTSNVITPCDSPLSINSTESSLGGVGVGNNHSSRAISDEDDIASVASSILTAGGSSSLQPSSPKLVEPSPLAAAVAASYWRPVPRVRAASTPIPIPPSRFSNHHEPRRHTARYAMVRKIGSGSQADVYLSEAIDADTYPRKVAVKLIRTNRSPRKHSSTSAEDWRGQARREAKIMETLRHRNILELLHYREYPDQIHIVTEYVQGCDLLAYVNSRGALTEAMARYIMRPIVSALCYAHGSGVFHRDIKLENILLEEPAYRPVIADWGYAGAWAPGYFHTAWLGSRSYCAPELFENRPYIGPEIDVWSLGVTLYALIFARLPFSFDRGDKEANESLVRALRHEIPLPWAISNELAFLISGMLHPDPGGRYSMFHVYDSAWLNMVDECEEQQETTTAPPPPPTKP